MTSAHIQLLPLAKLKASPENTRKNGGRKVDDLVASIGAHGLLQNLTVVETDTGHEVVAGGRRLRALQQLAKAGKLPADLVDGVPCKIVQADAGEVSLAENIIREAMHPLDQFTQFQKLADAGTATADIAAHFGVTDLVVRQRMRLSRVSPKLLKVYGQGGMTLEQLQAFAVSDDHERQEGVWKRARGSEYSSRPEQLRRDLSSKEAGTEDPRVQLVGLAAYEASGGRLRRDLFSDAVFVEDLGLLEQLVGKALEEAAEVVRAEGWKWVEIGGFQPGRMPWNAQRRIQGDYEADRSKAELAEERALSSKKDLTIAEAIRLDELQSELFTAKQKAGAGARVFLHPDGLGVARGLLRDKDKAPAAAKGKAKASEPACEVCGCTQNNACDGGCYWVRPGLCSACAEEQGDDDAPPAPRDQEKPAKESAACSQRLVADLTLARTGALRTSLMVEQEKAITALTAHLAESWRLAGGFDGSGGIGIQFRKGPDAGATYHSAALLWQNRLPARGPVLDWLLEQKDPWTTTSELLAFLIAESLDVVKRYSNQDKFGDQLATYLGVDMADHWRPDALFLEQLPSASIFAALEEIGTDAARLRELRKLKKSQLAEHAAALLAPTRWVPECIRTQPPAKRSARGGKRPGGA